jgi:hypothetical protein
MRRHIARNEYAYFNKILTYFGGEEGTILLGHAEGIGKPLALF